MNLTSTAKRGLVIGAIALLAIVGLIGWTRGTSAPSDALVSTAAVPGTASDPQPGAVSPAGAPAKSRSIYAASPFGRDVVVPPSVPQPPAASYRASSSYSTDRFADRPAASAPVIQTAAVRRRRVARRTASYRPRKHVVVRRRPFKHSAAIVGGSAAGGALIGALAGGGKGAAIGALAGGGGGLAYDRLTHKKKVVVER
jgi:hypothetical protein